MVAKESRTTEGRRSRQPYTPGWSDQLVGVEGLPIKKGGKVLKVKKIPAPELEAAEEDVVIHDDADEDQPEEDATKEVVEKVKKVSVAQPLTVKPRSELEEVVLKQRIADICTSITANPETAVLRKQQVANGAEEYGLKDLLALLGSRDVVELELAMMSACLVFKDICPSYRIRTEDEESAENSAQLKKDTVRLRDFELNLLKGYQRLLRALEGFVTDGLGNVKHELSAYDLKQRIGMVALRCQCELLRSLNQFNLRSNLLTAVVSRAAQPADEVTNTCCDALDDILKKDIHCDLSFEFVGTISKVLAATKYTIPDRLLRCLQAIKLTVHEDKVKALQMRVKSERKKRKRNVDNVETMMLEANMEAEKLSRQRFQGNSLQEIALIYFRVLKAKVGFKMLPAALEGLGKITHLINLDTVMDLLTNLRALLALEPSPPVEVKLLCVHCALSTLSGPGEELRVDVEPYILHLQGVLKEIPLHFNYWPAVIDCLDLCLLKKRVENNDTVTAFVRLLLVNAAHRLADVGAVLLSLLHNILLRYPRIRQSLLEKWSADAQRSQQSRFEEEEKVEDFAMQALRDGDSAICKLNGQVADEDCLGDGSWVLALVKSFPDSKYRKIVDTILSKDIAPLHFQASDAAISSKDMVGNQLDLVLSGMLSDKQVGKAFGGAAGKKVGPPVVNKNNNKHQQSNKKQRKK